MKSFRRLILPVLLFTLVCCVGCRPQPPVVRAVLFFSPGCPHCQTVLTEVLPPLNEQYGERLLVWKIDVTQPGGVQLYRQAVEALQVPNDRRGVPTLIIGDQVLVGANEIPQRLPGLIKQVLAQGGVDWPALPALAEGK